ncbi:putative plant self-incompatibility S1 [Rosa chinensis]|uniref:S-protein homolog n=1 Tax=Rosa chinensis TaxID=74649 RepID=A0A2P6QE21_ROSCH|nr:putative plant self-incompatibility S1 [Rosa chinensis]
MASLVFRSFVFLPMMFVLMVLTMSEAKTHVRITNDLPNNMDLTVHCKSREDNLGAHVLSYLDSYEFRFNPNIVGSTLFYCSMAWPSHTRYFNIYSFRRDGSCEWSKHVCLWRVTPEGPCIVKNLSNNQTVCYNWKKE